MKPLITIVVPCRNEQDNLPDVITALDAERQRHGIIGDIIVVDNHSDDNSHAVAQTLPCITLQAAGNVGAVRNAGARLAGTPCIGFIDADVIISPDWSLHAHEVLVDRQHGALRPGLVTGSIYDIPADANWLERTWFGSLAGRTSHSYINAGNLVMDRDLFNRIGGFDASLVSGEDRDLCERAVAAGGRLQHAPAIHAVHLGYPKTIAGFAAREIWHGREMIRDIGRPFSNRALLLALGHLLFLLAASVTALLSLPAALVLLAAYPAIPLTLAGIRTGGRALRALPALGLLISVYGFARAWALVAGGVHALFRQQ